jgi:hypothetical protein
MHLTPESRKSSSISRLTTASLLALLLAQPLATTTCAQTQQSPQQPQPVPQSSTPDLPTAPTPINSPQPLDPHTPAAITGSITDPDGATIPGAIVTLEETLSGTRRTTVSDPNGTYSFPNIPAGSLTLTVSAIGFANSAIASISVQPGQQFEVPAITLQMAAVDTTVQAISQHDMAEQQLKVEERQRLFGVVPNFYVSYTWNAVPLTSGQKFKLAWRSSIDPFTFIGAGISAGIQQGNNTYPGYGLGAAGYAKRYGAAYGDAVIGTFLGGAVLPSLLHQDPRYFYRGTGSFASRAGYALASVWRTRGDNGRWQPNYSDFFGDLAAGGISNAYYPPGDRGAGTTFGNFGLDIISDSVNALVQEFILRKVTRHPPPITPENP